MDCSLGRMRRRAPVGAEAAQSVRCVGQLVGRDRRVLRLPFVVPQGRQRADQVCAGVEDAQPRQSRAGRLRRFRLRFAAQSRAGRSQAERLRGFATPRLLVFNSVFAAQKPAQPVTGPTGAAILPSPSRLRRARPPTAKPRPSSFSTRFLLRENRRAHPPAFGRRGVDKVRKYHFVCVVLSSAPLTLSPLYAPARPVFRNRPKEKAAAENRCGCEHAIYEL